MNKYKCFLIYNISNEDYDSSPHGGYYDWTAPLFVAILARDNHSL